MKKSLFIGIALLAVLTAASARARFFESAEETTIPNPMVGDYIMVGNEVLNLVDVTVIVAVINDVVVTVRESGITHQQGNIIEILRNTDTYPEFHDMEARPALVEEVTQKEDEVFALMRKYDFPEPKIPPVKAGGILIQINLENYLIKTGERYQVGSVNESIISLLMRNNRYDQKPARPPRFLIGTSEVVAAYRYPSITESVKREGSVMDFVERMEYGAALLIP